ncbi:MAG: T9SS type A sorting domain-containing protein [Ekhidna sp.]|nr:T9SS type A sorting domain-containing protein [Ekhidna sp.]
MISNCNIRFSDGNSVSIPNVGNINGNAAIQIFGANPTLSNNDISEVDFGMSFHFGAEPTVSNNVIDNTNRAPLALSVSSDPVFSGNTFGPSIGWNALGIINENVSSDQTLSKRNVAGFENITYVIIDELNVSVGAKLTIASGITIKFPTNASSIDVAGGLTVAGTAEEKVVFTSLKDDNAGSGNTDQNDTEGDGNSTEPNRGDWDGINYLATSQDVDNVINHAEFRYAGYRGSTSTPEDDGALVFDGAGGTVTNTLIDNSAWYGIIFANAANPSIESTTISNCGSDPLGLDLLANPTFPNEGASITFNQNFSNGIGIVNRRLAVNASLAKRSLAGIQNIAHVLRNDLIVESSSTFAISEGVVIKLVGSADFIVEGTLNATGTENNRVVFTDIRDDSRGGDTNVDGSESNPAPGGWGGFDFRDGANGSSLNFCEIRYGKNSFFSGTDTYAGVITSTNNNLTVDNCIIELCSRSAFSAIGSSTASFIDNTLRNIGRSPVFMSAFADPTFSGNTLQNIGTIGIELRPETFSQNATLPQRSFGGFDNITYLLVDDLEVGNGTTLTIPAGTVFKDLDDPSSFVSSSSRSRIIVNGNLQVSGNSTDNVIFTDYRDDEYGNPADTQQDGDLSIPKSQASRFNLPWIVMENQSDDQSTINHAIFRYRQDDAIELNSASPTMTNNTFEFCENGIGMEGVSEPVITGNIFNDLEDAPMRISLVAYPSQTQNNVISGSTYKAIRVNSETLTQDTTLYKRAFASIDNIPYLFSTYTVGLGVTLTVESGIVAKFNDFGRFTVNGGLVADGEPGNGGTIVFTSIEDDFYGGDTNSNGIPNFFNRWYGILLNNEALDDQLLFDYNIIRYVGPINSGTFGINAIEVSSASPSISNSRFENNRVGILISGASQPVLNNNDFLDNSEFAINNTGSFIVDASNSWWGEASGPTHAGNSNGTGDAVSDNVTYDPFNTEGTNNPITGDVSKNGQVSAFDAALVLQSVVDLITLDTQQTESADVTGNGEVTSMDASKILQFAADSITFFDAEATNRSSGRTGGLLASDEVLIDSDVSILYLPIYLTNINDLKAFQSTLSFDQEVFKLVEVNTDQADIKGLVSNFDNEQGLIKLAMAKSGGHYKSGSIGTLVFEIDHSKLKNDRYSFGATGTMINDLFANHALGDIEFEDFDPITSIEEDLGLLVYPNPIEDKFTLQLKSDYGLVQIDLFDLAGAKMGRLYQGEVSSSQSQINFSKSSLGFSLDPGVYFLSIKHADGVEVLRIYFK